jgi:Ras family protein A
MAKMINAYAYHECSAKTGEGVQELFQLATRAALTKKEKKNRKKGCSLL